MQYQIEYYQPQNQYIKITAEFDTNELSELIVTFPDWRPGRYELGNFSKNIRDFKCLAEDNKRLEFKKINKNEWLVDCPSTKKIKVSYFYYAADLNAGSTFMDDQQLYVNPVNCLIYVKDQQNNPCELELLIPQAFKVASGIPFINNVLKTESYHELVDTPFIASAKLKYDSYFSNNTTFHIWVMGDALFEFDRVKTDFIAFTRAQIKNFGQFPTKDYHFLFQILPYKAYHGVEHQHSTVISLGPTHQIMYEMYDDLLGVSSHELYHSWNIKAIRPKDMQPYDYSKENFSTLGYVAEGVTTYMGDLYLSLSHVKSWKWYQKELEILLQRHFDNLGRFNYSVAESSWDTWLDGYVKGAPHRKVSIYNEGAILAWALDGMIRTNTNNQQSLHDVMSLMNEKFGKTAKGYTDQDYMNAAKEIAGVDFEDFFNQYVFKANAFEPLVTETLNRFGLELKTELNPDFSSSILGIKTEILSGKTLISQIYPGSPADMAKLSLNDEILAINQYAVNSDLSQWVRYFETESIQFTIKRHSRILNIQIPNLGKRFFPIYKINKAKAPSNFEKRVFKKWCGYAWEENETN